MLNLRHFAGAGHRHGAHGLLHARDDRIRPAQGHQGTAACRCCNARSVTAAFSVEMCSLNFCMCPSLTRCKLPLNFAGTEPAEADPCHRHVVRRRAPEDQPVSQPT